jgi:hypothetical protein
MLERSNVKRPLKVATEAMAEEEEERGNEAHVAAVAVATATATAAEAATTGNWNALSAVPQTTLHVTVPNKDNRAHKNR